MAKADAESPVAASVAPVAPAGNYTVLARRYRPRQFIECIGQEHVVHSLENAIKNDRVAHAYLFTGSRGVGKTSMARIFAKALNCVTGPTVTPCDQCDICRAIAVGEDIDVIEIDGASNNKVEEIRELRQGVGYRPSRARYRIYLIDEVHMVTTAAFNALLKTLEEPPPHVKFLFATTDPQKLPITILSRCQRFDFAGIETGRIADRLKEIVRAEEMTVDDETIDLIARRAGGSMRDSQSLLDQLLALGGGALSIDDVHRILGTAGDERIIELAAAVFAGDAAGCLAAVDSAVAAGVHLGDWLEQLLNYYRDLLVLSVNSQAELLSMPSRMRPTMLEQSQALSPERLLEMMDVTAAARMRLRGSSYGRAIVEMTLVRLCRLDQFISVAGLMNTPGATGPAAAPAPVKKNFPVAVEESATLGAAVPAAPRFAAGVMPPPIQANDPIAAPPVSIAKPLPSPTAPVFELTAENLPALVARAFEQTGDEMLVGMLRMSVGAMLRPPATIVVNFPTQYGTAKVYCENPSRVAQVESVLQQLVGRPFSLRFEQVATEGVQIARPGDAARRKEQAAQIPLVRRAQQVLDAKVLDVDVIAVAARPTIARDFEQEKSEP